MVSCQKPSIPASFLFRRHLYYCENFPVLFQRSGVGSAHKKSNKFNVLFVVQKNQKNCIEPLQMVILQIER